MRGRRPELRHISDEASRVGEFRRGAMHVILFQQKLYEARVLLGRRVDILTVQQCRGEASMRDEVLRIDRDGRP